LIFKFRYNNTYYDWFLYLFIVECIIYQNNEYDPLKLLCGLCEKIYHQKTSYIILTENEEIMINIDSKLWTFSTEKFIPHGMKNDEKYKELQPIYITDDLIDLDLSKYNGIILFCINNPKDILDKISKLLEKIIIITVNDIDLKNYSISKKYSWIENTWKEITL
jgi:DNA polymerase IIIc chi subunit